MSRGLKFNERCLRFAEKGEAVVQKLSADTQEHESCQQNELDVDRDEAQVEFCFVPSVVSDSAGWRESKFMCDRQCRKESFKFHDIASLMAEDDGEPPFQPLHESLQSMARRKEGTRRWAANDG